MSTATAANPVCLTESEPPPPRNGELADPAEPHPDEPGAPPDAPEARELVNADASEDRVVPGAGSVD